MSRRPAFLASAFAGLLLGSPAWALSQSPTCRSADTAHKRVTLDGPMCLLLEDPWQDCDEDPWQLSSTGRPADTFSDPWQDDVDPWQPVFTTGAAPLDAGIDPWQPVSRLVPPAAAPPVLDTAEDPWQPSVLDPWQDDPEDPWQVP